MCQILIIQWPQEKLLTPVAEVVGLGTDVGDWEVSAFSGGWDERRQWRSNRDTQRISGGSNYQIVQIPKLQWPI